MNVKRKQKAIKLIGSKTDQQEIQDLLLENEFTLEEVGEVLKAKAAEPANENEDFIPKIGEYDPKNPNASLDLSGFNFKSIKGESFKNYVQLVGDKNFLVEDEETNEWHPINGKLRLDDQYDFELYKVRPIRKKRYQGIENSPVDYVGLEIKDDAVIHTSRMPVKAALEHNLQITNAHSLAGHGKYYFLKKAK